MYDMSGKALEIKLDIPFGLPVPPASDPSVKRNPLLEIEYDSDKALAELKKALGSIPGEFHEQLAPELLEEYKKYGHIYIQRFRPWNKIKAKLFTEYKGNCMEGKVMQKLLDEALDTDLALYPYELVTEAGKAPVCGSWTEYEILKKYLSIVTEELTLVIENGKVAGLFRSAPHEPRIVITEHSPESSGTSWLPAGKEINTFILYTALAKAMGTEDGTGLLICSEYGENLAEQTKAAEALKASLLLLSRKAPEKSEELSAFTAAETPEKALSLIKEAEKGISHVLYTGDSDSLYSYLVEHNSAPACIIREADVSYAEIYGLLTKKGTSIVSPDLFVDSYFINEGYAPFSWYCLSEKEEDLKATEKAVRDCIDPYRGAQAYDSLRWLKKEVGEKGIMPGRSILLDEETAMLTASKLNDMVRNGEVWPLFITDSAPSLCRRGETAEKAILRFAGSCSGGSGIVILTKGKTTSSVSGIILDGSEKTDRIIKAAASRNCLTSFISGVQRGHSVSCKKAEAFNKKRSDGHIAIPHAVNEDALKQLFQ